MTDILLITENKVKEFTFLQDNVDAKLIRKSVQLSQIKYLKPILNDTFYQDIIDKVKDSRLEVDPIPLTPEYTDLIDNYIKPCLANYAAYEVLYFISFDISNRGITQRNVNNDASSQIADLASLSALRNLMNNTANTLKNEMIKFIKNNKDNYPLYFDECKNKNDNDINSSIYFY